MTDRPTIPVMYNHDFCACDYSCDTTRKSRTIAQALADNPIAGVVLTDPSSAYATTEKAICAVHSPEYVEAVRTGTQRGLAESQGFDWDERIWLMALAHNAGVVAALEYVLAGGGRVAGTLSSGLHHAAFDRGNGFCTFNGLAVAAHVAAGLGLRVLVFDVDAHCGGGTAGLLPDTAHQVDLSVSGFDNYRAGERTWLRMAGASDYDEAIDEALAHIAGLGQFDVVLYNAGMDPANCGVSIEQLARRERMIAAHDFGCPVVFTLAGGYTWGSTSMDEVVDLHRLTIEAFAGV